VYRQWNQRAISQIVWRLCEWLGWTNHSSIFGNANWSIRKLEKGTFDRTAYSWWSRTTCFQ
jgi:hypothetical protein